MGMKYNYWIKHCCVSSIVKEQAAWMKSSFGNRGTRWTHKSGVFLFKNEEDRNWFLMRWSK